MYAPVPCVNCGKESKPVGDNSAFARIELSSLEFCNTCNHSHKRQASVNFCSITCLILYSQRSGDRLIRFERDLVNNVRTSAPDYVNPLYEPKVISNEPDDTGLTQEEKNLIDSNQIIQAIKSIRARTRLGLKESKDVADAYNRKKRGW